MNSMEEAAAALGLVYEYTSRVLKDIEESGNLGDEDDARLWHAVERMRMRSTEAHNLALNIIGGLL